MLPTYTMVVRLMPGVPFLPCCLIYSTGGGISPETSDHNHYYGRLPPFEPCYHISIQKTY